MGWGDCGQDSQGRNIGYVFPATCDFPGCKEKIDRGLAYACGGMHGEDSYSCEKYFCYNHKNKHIDTPDGDCLSICQNCLTNAIECGWDEEPEKWIEEKDGEK